MRYENVVGRYFFDVDRFRERVLGDKWIKQQVFPADFGGKAGVAVLGNFSFDFSLCSLQTAAFIGPPPFRHALG